MVWNISQLWIFCQGIQERPHMIFHNLLLPNIHSHVYPKLVSLMVVTAHVKTFLHGSSWAPPTEGCFFHNMQTQTTC